MRLLSSAPADSAGAALRLALGLWLAVALGVTVRTLVRPASHTVFPVFAAGAGHWWADQPLYRRDLVLDDFRYPPTFAVAVSPLGALGLRAGGVLWSWLSIALLLAGLWQFARHVLPADWSDRRRAAFLALACVGALRGLWNAQSNAVTVGLLLLGAAELARQRWWRSAFLLAGAVWVKLTPLAPALLLAALWRRRLLPRLAVALAVIPLFPFLTRPPGVVLHHWGDWLAHLACTGDERWPGFRDAWTVWLALRHTLEGSPAPLPLKEPLQSTTYRLLQLLSAAATLGWCLAQQRRAVHQPDVPARERRHQPDAPARANSYPSLERRAGVVAPAANSPSLARRVGDGASPRPALLPAVESQRWLVRATLALGCAWLMLFGPAVEYATYVFLAPVLAWAALERTDWRAGRRLIAAALVLVLVLGWGGLTRQLADRVPLVLAALPAGTTLFAIWLIGHARHLAGQQAVPEVRTLPLPERHRRAAA
jgi:hypothetical protein